MKISKVRIKGFRSLADIEVNLQGYTSLIGQNDSGKSSFLHALNFLFDKDRTPAPSDICSIEGHSDEVFVEATLCNCAGHEEFAANGEIKLRRIFRNSNWIWERWGRVPKDDTIKKIHACAMSKEEWKNSSPALPEDVVKCVNTRLDAHKGKVPNPVWTVIFEDLVSQSLVDWENGWLPFDKEALPSLVTVVMLEANMRGEEELVDSSKSMFNRVGGLLLREAAREDPEMAEAVERLNDVVKRVAMPNEEGKWGNSKLNSIQEILEEEIGRFDSSIKTQSTLVPPKMPNLEFSVKVEVSDSWVHGIDKMGHGMRRSVVFAMLRAYRRIKTETTQKPLMEAPAGGPLFLFLVEEPELYLHPQKERARKDELEALAQEDGPQNTQVVLCTHSAFFVDLHNYLGIIRFERQNRQVTKVYHWKGPQLQEGDRDLLTMAYRFNENRAALLFAKFVILTEGQTEKLMLPHLARKYEFYDPEVEVVDCGGNMAIPVIQSLLQNFGIRYVAWLDRDDDAVTRTLPGKPPKTNKESLIAIKKTEDAMDHQLGRLIVLRDDWEALAGVPRGDKPHDSWMYFVIQNNGVNPELEAKLKAAYTWESHIDP